MTGGTYTYPAHRNPHCPALLITLRRNQWRLLAWPDLGRSVLALAVVSCALHIDNAEAGSMPVFGMQGGTDVVEPVTPDLLFLKVGTTVALSPWLRDG